MADETKPTEMVKETPEVPEPKTDGVVTPTVIDPAEFAKMQAALKEANKEAAARRKRLDELEAAETKRKEAEMTESEKTAKRIQELEAETNQLKREKMQRAAAEKVGLAPDFALRLQGSTGEELEADAKMMLETMLKALPQPLPPPQKPAGINPTNPPITPIQETESQMKERLFGKRQSIFDGAGGGVYFTK